jgi:hypothetical protein
MSVPIYDPFQQFQTAGASYIDPRTGQPISGASGAPAGTPFYQSSQLTQNGATGATASATGTEANPFAGFTDAYGGGYGYNGDGTSGSLSTAAINADPTNPANASRGVLMDAVSGDGSRVANALNSGNADAVTSAMQNLFEQQSGGLATGANGAAKTSLLTPDFLSGITDPAIKAQIQAAMVAQGDIDPNKIALGGDASGTSIFAKNPASVDAANAASAAQGLADQQNAPPPPDADPFGRFDDPAHPTHGVITPAIEAQMAAQADASPSALTTNPDGSPMNASPINSVSPTIPRPTPPVTPATPPTINPGVLSQLGPTDTGGMTPANVPQLSPQGNLSPTDPTTGQPSPTPSIDPFAPFQQNPIKSAGSSSASPLAAY